MLPFLQLMTLCYIQKLIVSVTDLWFRDDFRRGVVQGDKPVIYPVLEWLLRHMSELKERAYLARYLVKVDIPQDFMVDPQIAELYEQVCLSACQHVPQWCTISCP